MAGFQRVIISFRERTGFGKRLHDVNEDDARVSQYVDLIGAARTIRNPMAHGPYFDRSRMPQMVDGEKQIYNPARAVSEFKQDSTALLALETGLRQIAARPNRGQGLRDKAFCSDSRNVFYKGVILKHCLSCPPQEARASCGVEKMSNDSADEPPANSGVVVLEPSAAAHPEEMRGTVRFRIGNSVSIDATARATPSGLITLAGR